MSPDNAPTALTPTMLRAWEDCCKDLTQQEKLLFLANGSLGLDVYTTQLKDACQKNHDQSRVHKTIEFLQPLFALVQLIAPAADSIASAADITTPIPASLIVGGILQLIKMTARVEDYQTSVLSHLTRMGRKARVLRQYEGLYKNEESVQDCLIAIYKTLLQFCQKAVRYVAKPLDGGKWDSKITGLKLALIKPFNSILGDNVKQFEDSLDELQDLFGLLRSSEIRRILQNQEDQQRTGAKQLLDFRDDIKAELKRIDDARDAAKEKARRLRTFPKLLQWLSRMDHNDEYAKRSSAHVEGTGTWFKQSREYRTWKKSDKSELLWVWGKPGCGKSMLSALAVADIQAEVASSPDTAMAFAFCLRDNDLVENANYVLGGLAKQIVKINNARLENDYPGDVNPPATLTTISAVFDAAINEYHTVYLIVDGLDECKERETLLRQLLAFYNKPNNIVKLLVFSRSYRDIKQHLAHFNQLQPDHEDANAEDLKTYISSFSDFPPDIRETCLERADGMFLWVKLLHDNLSMSGLTLKQKRKLLQEIPPTLDAVYNIMMSGVETSRREVQDNAILTLLWTTHAPRPLTTEEMLHAVADFAEVTSIADIADATYVDADELVQNCMNLIYVSSENYVRVVHDSVRTYLLEADIKNPPRLLSEFRRACETAHIRLARVCLSYIALPEFDRPLPRDFAEFQALHLKYAFLGYAADYWGWHANKADSDILTTDILMLARSARRRHLSLQIRLWQPSQPTCLWSPATSEPLDLLAVFGLVRAAKELLQAEQRPQDCYTALTHASRSSREDMALWLVRENVYSTTALTELLLIAAINAWPDLIQELHKIEPILISNAHKPNPLIHACARGNHEVAKLLLALGGDYSNQDEDGDTALTVSASAGQTSIVELILRKGADCNIPNAAGLVPIHCTIINDHKTTLDVLLQHNAILKATPDGDLPFHMAAGLNAPDCLQLLLQPSDLDLDVLTVSGETALHYAAFANASRCLDLLLQRGADPDRLDGEHRTALIVAVSQGHEECVTKLLEAPCDINMKDNDGDTALHIACAAGRFDIVKTILSHVRNEAWTSVVNSTNKLGETPLHHSLDAGNKDIFLFLLRCGADASISGRKAASLLHYAAHYGYTWAITPLLLANQAVNTITEDGDTILHFAARTRKGDFILRLQSECKRLDLRLDYTIENTLGRSIVMTAMFAGDETLAQNLLQQTPSVIWAHIDTDGDNLLHVAGLQGLEGVIEQLQSLDICSRGRYGRTSLANAASKGHEKTVRTLLSLCPEALEIADDDGNTPLALSIKFKHLSISHLLLDSGARPRVNDKGWTLLHHAVCNGDIALVKRVLGFGVTNGPTTSGWTPFQVAVEGDDLPLLELLIEHGCIDVEAHNEGGYYCDYTAAANGNLAMLKRLDTLGSPFGRTSKWDSNAAHAACGRGHVQVLDFLKEKGVALCQPDRHGNTPLMHAAFCCHITTVRYLIGAGDVNEVGVLNETALHMAALKRAHDTANILIDAGCNPYIRDHCGVSAAELLTGFDSVHSDRFSDAHKQMQRRSLRQVIAKILDTDGSVLGCDDRRMYVSALAQILRCLDEGDLSRTVMMENLWQSDTRWQSEITCDICKTVDRADTIFTCKTCYLMQNLCVKCHREYEDCDREASPAWLRLWNLEDQMRPILMAAAGSNIFNVCKAIWYMRGNRRFIDTARARYEEWEQDTHIQRDHSDLKIPGKIFLDLVFQADDIFQAAAIQDDIDGYLRRRISDLEQEFHRFSNSHRADSEYPRFSCKDHEYLDCPRKEAEAMRMGDDLDEHGRLTDGFLKRILELIGQVGRPRKLVVRAHTQPTINAKDTTNDAPNNLTVIRAATFPRQQDKADIEGQFPTIRSAVEATDERVDYPEPFSFAVIPTTEVGPSVTRPESVVELSSLVKVDDRNAMVTRNNLRIMYGELARKHDGDGDREIWDLALLLKDAMDDGAGSIQLIAEYNELVATAPP